MPQLRKFTAHTDNRFIAVAICAWGMAHREGSDRTLLALGITDRKLYAAFNSHKPIYPKFTAPGSFPNKKIY